MQQQTVVLVPFGGGRDHGFSDLIEVLRYQLSLLVVELRRHAQLDIGRSLLATSALHQGADVVVFIDSDMLFDPLDVERIANVARETRGVVGAPYSERRMGGHLTSSPRKDIEEMTFFEGGGLYPSESVIAMGFTAIHREAFERLHSLPEYAERRCNEGLVRPYFQKATIDGYWFPEDASFCHAVRSVGVSTHLDTRIRVKHVGDYAFGVEDCVRTLPDATTLKKRVRPP